MNPSKDKLAKIRNLMKNRGIDALIIPGSDPHLGEYVPDHWKVIKWLTGFTGSSANVVITRSFAGLWTDSRYFVQAEKQLEGSGISLMKVNMPPYPSFVDWLILKLRKDAILAFDGRLITINLFRRLKDKLQNHKVFLDTEADLISEIWINRPPMPDSVAFEHPAVYAGEERGMKIKRVREEMVKIQTDFCLLTAPEDIMWLLNIRANDIQYSPLLLSFALIRDDQVIIFTPENKIPFRIAAEFDRLGIVELGYDEINAVLSALPPRKTILLDPDSTSLSIYNSIPGKINIKEQKSIPALFKAVKNKTEIENLGKVMVKDGVALTKFLFWLLNNVDNTGISEMKASEKLLEFRLQQTNCTGESFATIMAYNEHGASPHYTPDNRTDSIIKPGGLLLVDSGGQYLDGTTDITRSVPLGKPTSIQKCDFTLALKGTISLSMAIFPEGTMGIQLDVLARKALWEKGLNYGHGTGHGVGFFLNVHEGPQSISHTSAGSCRYFLEPGMVLSNEPAIYREGEYGFRTENLMLVVEDKKTGYGRFLKFETLSLCFIDTELIEISMLERSETEWLNSYHKTVYEKISPFLSDEEKTWLKEKTKSI